MLRGKKYAMKPENLDESAPPSLYSKTKYEQRNANTLYVDFSTDIHRSVMNSLSSICTRQKEPP